MTSKSTRKRLTGLVCGLTMLTTPALADSAGPPAAQASGESAAASVETGATLASGAAMIPASGTVLIAGTGATLITGDTGFARAGAELAEDMLNLDYDATALPLSDAVLVADPLPALSTAAEE